MSDNNEPDKKTLLDRLIGSLKWGTVGTVAGAATGVGLGALARKGKFGRQFKRYASRKFPLFPDPAVTHAIAGAGVGSKVGTIGGLIVGRKKKDTKELSALLSDLIEFGSSGPMRLMRRELSIRKKGVTVFKPFAKLQKFSPERRVETRPLSEHTDALRLITSKRAEKWNRAVHRVNPNVSHGDLMSDPGELYNAGPGWDQLYQKYYSGMKKHERRMIRSDPDHPPPGRRLSSKLDDLIEFKLYQPGPEEKPPEGIPEFKPGEELDYVVQEHRAKKAGRHLDIRIGDKPRGMYSWATKKYIDEALPPGGKLQLHPQPIHPHSYNDFEGEISGGYGAGTVKTRHLGRALVTKSEPGQAHITVGTRKGSHRLAIINTKLGHLLVREKHPEPPTAQKPSYKSLNPQDVPEHLEGMEPGTVVQPKIDGALVYVKGDRGKLEVFSHRKAKSGHPIIHTERFFKGRPQGDLEGKTILGELYGTRKGRAIEPQELGGILNAHISRSLEKQREQKVDLKITPFDIQDKGSYPERLAKLKELVSRKLPEEKFTLPEEATTPKEALDLHEQIRKGKHPLTKEGIIIHPPKGKMIKVKNVKEANVPITGTFPGAGKFEGSHGGITYEAGRVGTGFSDETRRKLHEYVGRVARIRHQGKYPSGAYRAPAFIGIEENK